MTFAHSAQWSGAPASASRTFVSHTPRRGDRVSLGGSEGTVFWTGSGRGGAARVGVRVGVAREAVVWGAAADCRKLVTA